MTAPVQEAAPAKDAPAKGAAPTEVKIRIETRSWIVPKAWYMQPVPPVITMNGKAFPAPEGGMEKAHGYQVIAIDAAQDMTDPASILLNEYHYLPRVNETWRPHAENMYRQMIHSLLSAGDLTRQRVIVVSFGMDAGAPPPTNVYESLLRLGAGKGLQTWETRRPPEAPWAGDNYIEAPANYILIGYGLSSYGQGIETYYDQVDGNHGLPKYVTRAKEDAPNIQAQSIISVEATLANFVPAPRGPHPAHEPHPVH
jgi:hypothetical protein